jgi:hypothetical protein
MASQTCAAYRFYARTRDVLRMYQHLPSFTQIHNECEAIMRQVAQRLRVRLSAETVRPAAMPSMTADGS